MTAVARAGLGSAFMGTVLSTNCCRRSSTRAPAICTSPSASRPFCGCTAGCAGWKPRCSTAEDTVALMKSITPERCQTRIAGGRAGRDFGFAFGTAARFRVSVFKQRGNIGLVLRQIPNKLLTMEQLGLPEVCQGIDHAAARAVSGDRADRLGQEHEPGQHDQLPQ